MLTRPLGKSKIEVPVIGMGTSKTFNKTDPADRSHCFEVMQAGFENGIRLFDSSPMYGESESVLSEGFHELGIRSQVLVATKIWTDDDTVAQKQYSDSFSFYDGVVDLYQVHNLVRTEKRLAELEEFRDQGKVRAIGLTHWKHEALPEMMEWMQRHPVDAIQIPYNVGDRLVEREVLPLAAELGVGVLVMYPLGSGDLAKKSPPAGELGFMELYGLTDWSQVLLKWLISDSRVTCVIPATTKIRNAQLNALAGSRDLFDEELREKIASLASTYCLN